MRMFRKWCPPTGAVTTDLQLPLADLALWPSIGFVYLLALLQLGGIDESVAGFFYDPVQRGFPLKHDFWTERVLHDGAQHLMIGLGLGLLLVWFASWRFSALVPWRGYLSYGLLVILLSVGVANVGKEITNVDCPWDLAEFGGSRLYAGLLADKPEGGLRGRCFPGGHSSAGFALFALFFVARGRAYGPSWLALMPALLVGGIFAVDQWSRGAHFPSHDLTSAYLCWMIALGAYAWVFDRRRSADENVVSSTPAPSPRDRKKARL
jgi:membrane-associated PAP2 superfamily phosphatase